MTAESDTAVIAELLDSTAPTGGHLDTLRHRLVVKAGESGLLDIAYRLVDSPVGTLLLAASRRGVIRVAYSNEDFPSVLDDLGKRVSPRILHAPDRLDPAVRQLEEYFSGDRRRFDLPFDLRLTGGFRSQVVGYLASIGYAKTATYGEVAAAMQRPRAARAVGTACATNPLPLFFPCHRVVRSDGRTGAYLGGEDVKRQLLEMEMSAAQRARSL